MQPAWRADNSAVIVVPNIKVRISFPPPRVCIVDDVREMLISVVVSPSSWSMSTTSIDIDA